MKGEMGPLQVIFVAFALALTAKGYVFDLKSHQLFFGDSYNSSFGYAMDFAQDSQGQHWLLVGAPKDRDDNLGLYSGLLKACKVTLQGVGTCDSRSPDLMRYPDNKELYEDQLFGVAVTTVKTGRSQEVWACAPRYQREHMKEWSSGNLEKYFVMKGHCFAHADSDQFRSNRRVKLVENDPLFYGRNGYKGRPDYDLGSVFAEAGMSIHFDLESNTKYFGAPGAWNWTGTYALQRSGESSTVMTQPWSPDTPRANDYAGFDLTTGTFVRTSSTRPRQVALGAPRAGNKRQGVVFVVETMDDNNVKQVAKVEGSQSGEYFGASVTAADLNGDKIDELIVGSPLFTNPSSSTLGYEEGRISIYSSRGQIGRLELVCSIYGPEVPRARFGSALATLGDLDEDGFEDFVVGAPFEGDGRGVIRIYLGRPDLENLEHGYVIKASEINDNLRGFGNAFIKNRADIDGNGLTDLAIGSYISGHAVILRRSPSVWVDMQLKPSIDAVDIENPQGFEVTLCPTLSTYHKDRSIFIEVEITLTIDALGSIFDNGTNSTTKSLRLEAGREACITSDKIVFKPEFNPTVNERPLEIRAEVRLIEAKNGFTGNRGVLDTRKPTEFKAYVPFKLGCAGGKCFIDLGVEAKLSPNFKEPFVIGSANFITILFTVSNFGKDPAFLPILIIDLKSQVANKYPSQWCEFQKVGSMSNDKLQCILPGPIKPGKSLAVPVDFDVSKLKGGQQYLDITNLEVYSKSAETQDTNPANDKGSFRLVLKTEADLALITSNKPEEIVIRNSDASDFLSKDFTQTYQVRNVLVSPIENIKIQVRTPTHYAQKEIIEYLSSELQLNNGQKFPCQKDATHSISTAGRAIGQDIPTRIDCISAPGTRCIDIVCPFFELLSPKESAIVMIHQRLLGRNLQSNFSITDEFKENGLIVASEGKIILDQYIEDLIKPYDNNANEVLAETEFVEITEQKVSTLHIGLSVGGAFVVLVLLILLLWCLGCFKRKSKEDFEAEEAKKKHGFEHNNT